MAAKSSSILPSPSSSYPLSQSSSTFPSRSSSAPGEGRRLPPRAPSDALYMMSRESWEGRNSHEYAAWDTAGTPDFRAPTHRPAVKRYSTPLPAGHCADGAWENGRLLPGQEPNMPQLPTFI